MTIKDVLDTESCTILGAGIAGLIFAERCQGFVNLVGPVLGGDMLQKFSLGPRYLHATETVAEYLESIGLEPGKQRNVTVGVYPMSDNGVWEDWTPEYFLKTRGLYTVIRDDLPGRRIHTIFETPTLGDLTKQLIRRLGSSDGFRYYEERCVRLFDDMTVLTESGSLLKHTKLVTTLPVPMFLKLLSPEMILAGGLLSAPYHAVPVKFVFYSVDLWPFDDEYVYVPSDKFAFSRLTKISDTDGLVVCAEYSGAMAYLKHPTLALGGSSYSEIHEVFLPFGRLLSRPVDYSGLGNVLGLGRFGLWQDWMLTHDVIATVVN
jgi:hypothetical protein